MLLWSPVLNNHISLHIPIYRNWLSPPTFEAGLYGSKSKLANKSTKFNFSKINFYHFNSELASIDRYHVLSNSKCDLCVISFSVTSSPTCLCSYSTWFNTRIYQNILRKHALGKKFLASKNDIALAHFSGRQVHPCSRWFEAGLVPHSLLP